MEFGMKFVAVSAVPLALAGCIETGGGDPLDDGLSGTQPQFDRMVPPCIAQASRFASVPESRISVEDRIRTGGGPILTLDVDGTRLTCRLEDDGSVTVFSEFAN